MIWLRKEVAVLSGIKKEKSLNYTVHLPASLEIAADSAEKRCAALQMFADIVSRCDLLKPQYYVLHVPITTPTLAPEPGVYFSASDQGRVIKDGTKTGNRKRDMTAVARIPPRLLFQ